MRTTVTLDHDKVNSLLLETKARSKAKAVLIAIEEFLRTRQLRKILLLKGKLRFHPQTAHWRHLEQ